MIRFTTAWLFLVLFLAFGVNASLAQSGGPPVLRGTSSTTTRRGDETKVVTGSLNNSSPTLVTIPTIVMDRNGRYIANLHKEDFKIYDDGVEQQVASFASIEK